MSRSITPITSTQKNKKKNDRLKALLRLKSAVARLDDLNSGKYDTTRHFNRRIISPEKRDHLLKAAKTAHDLGLGLNRFITIDWEALGVSRQACGAATSMFLKYLTDLMRKRGVNTAYVYNHEIGAVVGCHVHILIHIPPSFQQWANKKVAEGRGRLTQYKKKKGGHKSLSISLSNRAYLSNAETYFVDLRMVARYILKDAEFEELRLLPRQAVEDSLTFKLAGCSQNLNQR